MSTSYKLSVTDSLMAYLERITESIYAHTKGKTIGNVGLIASDAGNYLIDTSMYPVVAREIRTEMSSIRTGKVNGAILTHYHFDHSGGNQVFHDVGIHSHKNALENMKTNYNAEKMKGAFNERKDKHLFEGLELTYPTKTFETNPYAPDDSDTIEVYMVGGHTSGSSLIYHKNDNALFAGDDLFAGLFPWGGDPTASPYDWLNATEFMINKSPSIIVPGHGDVQHSLKEVEILQGYLKKVIDMGEKLVTDNVDQHEAVLALEEIDSHPEKNEGMKSKTLSHWYNVISNEK